MRKIKFFIVIAVFLGIVAFLGRVYMSAKSPSSVKITVYKVELMKDKSDKNPRVIFSSPTGQEIDLTKDTGVVFGQSQMPVGTFQRIRMTVAGGIKMSIASARDNPCRGEIFSDKIFPVAGYEADPNSQAEINFATQEDGGGKWTGPKIMHLLITPLTIGKNHATRVNFRFRTADTLFCSGEKVQMLAPWSVWAETL